MAKDLLAIRIEPEPLQQLRALAHADRRSVGFLVRDSIDLYLEKRAADLERIAAEQPTRKRGSK